MQQRTRPANDGVQEKNVSLNLDSTLTGSHVSRQMGAGGVSTHRGGSALGGPSLPQRVGAGRRGRVRSLALLASVCSLSVASWSHVTPRSDVKMDSGEKTGFCITRYTMLSISGSHNG